MLLSKLKSVNNVQPETIKSESVELKGYLTSLNIAKWADLVIDNSSLFDYSYANYLYNTKSRIRKILCNIIYYVENKKVVKNGFSQTGFVKRELPKFNRLVLDYQLFKRNWSIEVSPNCLSELVELNHLKNVVPAFSKDRIYEVNSLSDAWSIFDQIYGQTFDLRNKLKHYSLAIKISSKLIVF